MNVSTRRRALLVAGLAAGVARIAAAAESFAAGTVRVLVGSTAGGTMDATSRLVSQQLGKTLGLPAIVENKPGAAGIIAMQELMRAPADGGTLAWVGNGLMAVSPYLYKKPGYDVKTLSTVSLAATSSFVMIAAPGRFADLPALVAYAKANPGKLTFGSNGVNGSLHLLAEMLKTEAGFDALHVPFKGSSESAAALMSGNIDFYFDAISTNLPLIKAGKVKALAVTGPEREASLPDVPTMKELGLPSMTLQVFYGYVGPPGMPAPVVAKLADAVRVSLADPGLQAALLNAGFKAQSSTPEAFRALVDDEGRRFQALIKAKGIVLID